MSEIYVEALAKQTENNHISRDVRASNLFELCWTESVHLKLHLQTGAHIYICIDVTICIYTCIIWA